MTNVEQPRPRVDHSAPIGSVDMPAFDEDGTSYEIAACYDCLPWHAEVVIAEGEILVREWHAVECPLFQRLLAEG